jgi:hypothetical protein
MAVWILASPHISYDANKGGDGVSKAETSETETVARRYFNAWTTGDRAIAASVLADDFRFTAGDMTIEGRDAFLDAGAFPHDATTTMVAWPTRARPRSRCTTQPGGLIRFASSSGC